MKGFRYAPFLLTLHSCVSLTRPPPHPQPQGLRPMAVVVPGVQHAAVTLCDQVATTNADGYAAFPVVLEGSRDCQVVVKAADHVPYSVSVTLPATGNHDYFVGDPSRPLAAHQSILPALERVLHRRAGIVRLDGRIFRDDDGPYLGVGTTLFWATWGYQHDRERLERNLDFLSRRGVDYIRVLGTVGPAGWTDRTVSQDEAGYDAAIAGLTDLAYDRYGLRIEWTLMGGSTSTDTPDKRLALLSRFLAMARGREHKIQYFEIGNELQQTQPGFTAAEMLELGRHLRAGTPNIVALTSPFDDAFLPQLYDGAAANLLTMHLDRSQSGTGGIWRPVRQAWEVQFTWGGAWTSDEPIGPGSSVATDDDPLRLAMSAAVTWLSGGAGYVLHTGAGVRGQPDTHPVGGFRPPNIWEVPKIEAILSGIATVRQLMPVATPNWARHNSNLNFAGYPFDVTPVMTIIARDGLLRSFAATGDGQMVMTPLVAREPIPYRARQPISLKVHDPLTGAVREEATLTAGQVYTLPPTDAAVVVGTLR